VKNQPERHLCVPEPAVRAHFDSRGICGARRVWTNFRRNFAPVLALILAAPLAALAQGSGGSTVPARVTDRVDVANLTTLAGNTHRLAQPRFDQGAAPADLPMNRMMLVLKRSPEQEAALQDLLMQQQVSSSASFHKWVTPDEFGQQFGPADSDIQAVTSWLASFGFQNIKVSRGRLTIEFSGTEEQLEAALHTSIHRFVVSGESHWANVSDPQIPAALAPVVAGVATLHNFQHKKTIVTSNKKVTAKIIPGERPQINLSANGQLVHALVPADFAKIYNIPSTATGLGATIAVLSDTDINLQDANDFRSLWGLPVSSSNPQIVLIGSDPGVLVGPPQDEATLDTEWTGGVAPQAQVDLVVGEDTNVALGTDLAEAFVLDNNLADIMTASFSSCELQNSAGYAAFYNAMAEQAAAQGITFLVSSGDGGPDTCDDQTTIPSSPAPADVNLLASTDFNLAVGGTEFNDCTPVLSCTDNAGTFWLASNGTNSESAKGYIPENVWNEVCTASQASSLGCTLGIWSSGGGASIVNTTTPPWQTGVTGLSSSHARLLPDVSVTAAGHDGYVVCETTSAGSCSGGLANALFSIAAGTSASVQAFGGIMALVVQHVGERVGIANYPLYKLAAAETYSNCNGSMVPSPSTLSACVFNDVTSGNTNIPNENGFSAVAGYDQATGLGSVNVANLLTKWNTAIIQPSKAALTLNGGTSTVTITHGASVTVAITITPGTGATTTTTPTGDVSLIANGDAACTFNFPGDLAATLSGGTANFATICLPGGSYPVHAHYEGDGIYLPSDSNAINVVVSKEASETELSIVVNPSANTCVGTNAVAYGSGYVLEVAVMNSGLPYTACAPTENGAGPTGQVTLTDSVSGSLGTFSLDPSGGFEDQAIQLTTGTHTLSANYAGDSSFSASGPSTFVVSVAKATTATTVAANPTNPSVGGSVTLTATVATTSNATANASQEPTGSVQFFVGTNTTPIGSAAAAGSVAVSGFAQATASIQTTALPQGNDSITAKYSGDTNYTASTSSGVTVNVGSAGINISSGCTSATIPISAAGQSGSCLITVSGANGFAGTVALSAAVTGGPSGAVYAPACNSFGTPDQSFTAPNTITLSSTTTSGNATMTCSTRAASGVMVHPSSRPSGRGWPFAGVAIALAGLLFLVTARRERRWALVPLAGLLAVVVLAGVSCNGSGYKAPGSSPGTTTGTYTITVTATPNSGTAQTTTVSVVVP
jgi:hypothetical protein